MQDAKLSRREREAQALLRSWRLVNGNAGKAEDGPPSRNDTNLYAIAQLAAFRLSAQRAIVSLVDANTQYILAEATQTLSPSYDATCGDDQFLLGIQDLPLSDAFCDHLIFEDSTSRHAEVNNKESNHFVSVDCQQDDRFKNHALVDKEGGVRFSVGVPLVSQNSGTLGALVVLDDSPRGKLGDKDIEVLQEYAQCVVRHLELVHLSMDPSREVSVLRGIARSFPDRYKSLSGSNNDSEAGAGSTDESKHEAGVESTSPPRSMEDWLLSAFNVIAELIRQCSLADGAVIFGPQEIASLIVTEGSSSLHDSGDSDAGNEPSSVLASCLQDGVVCPAVKSENTPSVRTLRRLASIYPRGMAFDVAGKTASVRDQGNNSAKHPQTAHAMDRDVDAKEEGDDLTTLHTEVLDTLAEAQTMVFLPIYDQEDDTLLAACFFWDSSGIRMANGSQDLLAYQVLGNFLTHSVAQVRMQNKDQEQSKFMSNFSHELRSPIHGILGAAQFLQDTMTNDHQKALLQSIVVSSNTLLDTLNVVLDYNKFENAAMDVQNPRVREGASEGLPAPVQPFYVQADVDLALLIEDATETVVAGHFFDNLPGTTDPEDDEERPKGSSYRARQGVDRGTTQDVKVILQLSARPSWSVRTSPGAVSRIIMNLVGNALKFTSTGNITVELEPQDDFDSSKIHVRLRVEDTGIGMTEYFRKHHLFAPYRQENQFAPGVGLGMSVLKHMVTSLHGDISVTSTYGEGTAVNVDLTFEASKDADDGIPPDLKSDVDRIKGKHLVLLDLTKMYDGHLPAEAVMAREKALRSVATNWLGMRVSTTSDINVPDADFYLFSEPPPVDDILEHHQKAAKEQSSNLEIPLVIVTTDSREAHMINRTTLSLWKRPGASSKSCLNRKSTNSRYRGARCGPRKLAKVLNLCQDRVEKSRKDRAEKENEDPSPRDHKPSEAEPETKRDQDGNAEDGEDMEKFNGPPSVSSALNPAPKKVSKTSSGDNVGDEDKEEEGHNKGKDNGKETHSQTQDQDSYQSPESEAPQPPFSKPLVLARTPTDVTPTNPNSSEKATNLHGLCVDDNKINLRLLVTLMRKEKHTYEQAENGQEALDSYKASSGVEPASGDEERKPFDFICMDIGMPVMNGIQCTKAIREYERQHNLKPTYIVACTAWGDSQTQREAEEAGMDAFLPKPLKFVNLKEMLSGLVKEE